MAASMNYPTTHDIDLEAEIHDRRYAAALAQVTVYDVITLACEILSEREIDRTHPLYALASHVLRHGSYKRSGKAAHMSDFLTRAMEDVCDEAVERCVIDILHGDQTADMSFEME